MKLAASFEMNYNRIYFAKQSLIAPSILCRTFSEGKADHRHNFQGHKG